MMFAIHGIALALCAVGCCLMARHRNLAWSASAILMLAVMVDVVVGPHLLPGMAWSALLIAASIGVGLHDRRGIDSSTTTARAFASLQVSLGTIVMAAILPFAHGEGAASGNHAHTTIDAFAALGLLVTALAGFNAVGVVRFGPSVHRLAEAVAMTLSLGAMTLGGALQQLPHTN